ncbi:MAG: hypothetical protein JW800_07170 [Candidatus Omnitrophica bacterium]|nr:hypothetical protein [Candidatus Omnitrophota bacterium]
MKDKRRLFVLTEYRSPNSHALNYPLLINKDFFDEKGISINFFDSLSKKIGDCDILFINSKFFKTWHSGRYGQLYDLLSSFRKKTGKILWFDTNDSTGTTQFNILPYVDGYYKSQILKDKSLYRRSFYGNRIYTDFYKNKFNITDKGESDASGSVSVETPLREEFEYKLGVSWNSALNEWGRYNYIYDEWVGRMRCGLLLKTDYTVRFADCLSNRSIDINGRLGLSHSRDTVRYQRQVISDILRIEFDVKTQKVRRSRYLKELADTKVAVSPFGWGEISCRDFDIIIQGALLFKQDMSHMETWPHLYDDGETYISFSWGLEDLVDKLSCVLRDRARLEYVSKKAQDRYRYYLYGGGRSEFCERLLTMIDS